MPDAHLFLKEVIIPNDVVIDATMGNGHDTVFLASICNNVFAFDVQDAAIEKTRERLGDLKATLIKDGHENVDKYVQSPIKGAIFNLGYLPHSDKQVITKPNTTIMALEKICGLLVKGGRIAITVYTGHDGGRAESDAVMGFVKTLGDGWRVDVGQARTEKAPYIVCINKLCLV